MNQAVHFFDDLQPIRRARKSDPQTSHVAALGAAKFAGGHARRILNALKLHGPRSASELEQIIGLQVCQIDRRTSELQSAGLIEPTGEVVRGCRVWRIVDKELSGAA